MREQKASPPPEGSCRGIRRTWLGVGLTGASGVWADALAGAKEPLAGVTPAAKLPQIQGVDSLLQVTLSLTLVILLIVLAAWLLRRFTRTQSRTRTGLRIIGGIPVGSRERVVLIEAGTTQMLLGVAPGRVSALHVFDQRLGTGCEAPEVASEFERRLEAALQPEKQP
jgi:flagellar protein FliO/FliZ